MDHRRERLGLTQVNVSKVEIVDKINDQCRRYVERIVRMTRESWENRPHPKYQDKATQKHWTDKGVLVRLGKNLSTAYTANPITRIGLGGYEIASLVMPEVWDITGGDEQLYDWFFEEYIRPLGVTTDEFKGRVQEDRIC